MRYSQTIAATALVACASGHGVITEIQGANGVKMPGLSVADGTPRDCSSNGCGSQADTAIIRDREIASGESPLGYTQGNGPILAETMVANFMGDATAPKNNGPADSVGVEDDIDEDIAKTDDKDEEEAEDDEEDADADAKAKDDEEDEDADAKAKDADEEDEDEDAAADEDEDEDEDDEDVAKRSYRQWIPRQLSKLFGGGGAGGGIGGLFGGGGDKADLPAESSVSSTAGEGATSGLPTCADDGTITMTFRQINQDGAGPLSADVDGTSGGTDPDAFQAAEVTKDVPGLGVQGLSLATNTDFTMEVQMPAGMTCEATVAGVDNVCVVRVRNGAAAGPFGGSAAFTQSNAARKRAVAYRLRKRLTGTIGSHF